MISLNRIDLNLLTIFCLINSVGSISKVADMLDISASAVSLLHRTAELNEAKITELLNMRQADVVFSTFSVESSHISCQKISDMTLVLIAANDNPLFGDTVTEEMFREANLVGYNTKNEKIIYHRSIVDKKFRSSERCLLTTSFASILLIVSTTDCLGIIPEKVFSTYSGMYQLKKTGYAIEVATIQYLFVLSERDQ